MYFDSKKSTNIIVDTINESNKQIELIYDDGLLYDFNIENSKCLVYKLKNRNTNWFYIHEQFLLRPQIMIGFKKHWSFIGEFTISDIKSFVFEKRYRMKIKKIKSDYSNSIFLNKNQIFPHEIVVTHYYDKSYWETKSSNVLVPYKIEVHLFDDTYMLGEIGNLTIKIKSFDADPKEKIRLDKKNNCENA